MTSWIDYSLQQNWSILELSRQQLADTNTNMPTENEANNASQKTKASEYENEIAHYEAQVVQGADLLKRADALDDGDREGAVAIYKEWCLIKEQWQASCLSLHDFISQLKFFIMRFNDLAVSSRIVSESLRFHLIGLILY